MHVWRLNWSIYSTRHRRHGICREFLNDTSSALMSYDGWFIKDWFAGERFSKNDNYGVRNLQGRQCGLSIRLCEFISSSRPLGIEITGKVVL